MYKYPVSNGIRVAITYLKTHIPSHLEIAGLRALISYEGQPSTCYGCNNVDHQYHDCPRRKIRETQQPQHSRPSWADIVQQDAIRQQPAVVRPRTIDMEGVSTVNTHKIQHKPPTPEVVKVGKQSTTDSPTTETRSPQDTGEDGMKTDNNPPSVVEKTRRYKTTKRMLGEAECCLQHPYPYTAH